MIMNIIISVFTLILMTSKCCGVINGGNVAAQDVREVNPQVYCGRYLAEKLAELCFKFKPQNKKADTGIVYNAILEPYFKDQEMGSDEWPWMSTKARSLQLASRTKRLVVDECCNKACSISELLSYC